jgi:SET domain-containing protein
MNDPRATGLSPNCFEVALVAGAVTVIVASRDIKAGEELFWTYGNPFWESAERE